MAAVCPYKGDPETQEGSNDVGRRSEGEVVIQRRTRLPGFVHSLSNALIGTIVFYMF